MIYTRREAWTGLQGKIEHNARLYAGLHERVNDWVAAAPVIALVHPVKPVIKSLKLWAAGGFRLNAVLRELGIPTCLKKLDTADVMLTDVDDLPLLMALGNEHLSQPVSKGFWSETLTNVSMGSTLWDSEPVDSAIWSLKNGALHEQRELDEIRDYFREHGPQWSWSKARILKEHKLWVRKLRTKEALEKANSPAHSVKLDLAGSPALIEIEGVTCRALVTTGQLLVEGARMQHCVGGGSFQSDLQKGSSRFYHLECDEGESTVEFVKYDEDVCVKQHYGEMNAKPPLTHKLAAEHLRGLVHVEKKKSRFEPSDYMRQVIEDEYGRLQNRFFGNNNLLGRQQGRTLTATMAREQMEQMRLMDEARRQQAMPPEHWCRIRNDERRNAVEYQVVRPERMYQMGYDLAAPLDEDSE